MTTHFDPHAHLIRLPRRAKDPQTGQCRTVYDDYLEVKWRLVWFREKFPHGSIITEAISLDWETGVAIYKATVGDGEGGIATGTGTETRKSFEDFVEKSETRSIGRALAALGIGAQFVGEELSEGDHVADAPVATPNRPDADTLSSDQVVTPPPSAPPRPTAEEIDRLFAIAASCQEPKDAFGTQLRRIMGLRGETRISKKFLREAMTGHHYQTALTFYDTLLRRQVEEDVPTHDPSPATSPPAPQDAKETTQTPLGPWQPSPARARARPGRLEGLSKVA